MKLNKKNIIIVLLNFLFIYIVSNMVFGSLSIQRDLSGLKKKKKLEKNRIEKLTKLKNEKMEELSQLEKDEIIEKIARERLYMTKNGEEIYRFVEGN